jgi:predicted nucleic acid-binding protein
MRILIDTRIWGLALKSPYYTDADSVKELSVQAKAFVSEHLQNDILCISSQLLAEIFHVLTERGRKIPKSKAEELVRDIAQESEAIYRNPDKLIFQEAIELSRKTCIHIWDFLIVLPFKGEVERIYTMDPHFKSCKELQIAQVENPIGVWEGEGAR